MFGIGSVLGFGIPFLVAKWYPKVFSDSCTRPAFFKLASHVFVTNEYGEGQLCAVLRLKEVTYFEYRCSRFILKDSGEFMLNSYAPEFVLQPSNNVERGVASSELPLLVETFGANFISIDGKSIGKLFMDEIFHPFNLFQVFSVILWLFTEYYQYALAIFLIMPFSISTSIYTTRRTINHLNRIARHESPVNVFRDNKWTIISSTELVPGDLIQVTTTMDVAPCDLLLLSGQVLCDESMLTGESLAMSKNHVRQYELGSLDPKEIPKSNIIYGGTRIVKATETKTQMSTAVVINVGFNTCKGILVRSILFPKPNDFKFYNDSFKFIGVMASVAVIGFLVTVTYLVIGGKLGVRLIIARSLDLFTVIVPPALPASLSVGVLHAISRLKKRNIFCISPSKIIVGGKLDLICFDKTGTLTEDGMDILGVVPVSQRLSGIVSDASNLSSAVIRCMASCHSVMLCDGHLVGEPMDVKMFEFSGWLMEEATDASGDLVTVVRMPSEDTFTIDPQKSLGIIRCFEFNSSLRRMSVIARSLNEDLWVYAKGAPESIREICDASSIPENFDQVLADFTRKGYRLLAIAENHMEPLSWIKVQKLERFSAESGLNFLGFLIFENKMKPKTKPIITELNKADIKTLICTGDNVLTGACVGKACGIIDRDDVIFAPSIIDGRVVWESPDSKERLDPHTLQVVGSKSFPFSLVCTGSILFHLQQSMDEDLFNTFLLKCKVYGRMSPEQKKDLVNMYQDLNFTVGFCGDGANDCHALQSADVGISLSLTEASIAAPFTSKEFDISCVLTLLRESRAALVTSFSCFKFMAMYSIIQFTSVCFIYAYTSNLSDGQFLYIDLFIIIPCGVLMNRFGSAEKLIKRQPTAKLVSKSVLLSIFSLGFVQLLFQTVIFVVVPRMNGFVDTTNTDPDDEGNVVHMITTSLFKFSNFLYLLVGFLFCAGTPFRESLLRNFWFLLYTLCLTAFSCYVAVSQPENFFTDGFLQLIELPTRINQFILIMTASCIVSMYLVYYVALPLLLRLFPPVRHKKWLQIERNLKKSI